MEKANTFLKSSTPDSALIYLDMIDYPQDLSQDSFAKYILLMVKAHYRNKIDITGDTLILRSIDYYNQKNDLENLSESYLYAGRIWDEKDIDSVASQYYLAALKISQSINDNKLIGRCAYALGELYQNRIDYNEAKYWLKFGINHFSISKNYFHLANTYRVLGDCYVLESKFDSALISYDKALNIVPANKYGLCSHINKNISIAYYKKKDFTKALSMIKQSNSIYPDETKISPINYLILSNIFEGQQQFDSAYYYCVQALSHSNNFDNFESMSQIYQKGFSLKTNKDLESYLLYKTNSDSIHQKQKYQTTATIVSLYNKERLLSHNQNLTINNQRYIIISFILILIFIVIILLVIKLRRRDLKTKDIEIKDIEQKLLIKEATLISIKISNEEYLKIYRKMVLLSISPFKTKYKKFLLEYNKLVNDNDNEFEFDWNIFCKYLNSTYIDYIQNITLNYPSLTEKDIQVIAMQKGEFEISEIATILNHNINTVYKRNSDIRKKLGIKVGGNIIEFIDNHL